MEQNIDFWNPYMDESLNQHVVPFMQAHPDLEMFQHDNASPHTAQVCTAALQIAGIPLVELPAKSPNISPIGNLWAILSNHIRDMQNPPTTVAGGNKHG